MPAARSGLNITELGRIERDLYDTDPFVPLWTLELPLAIGGVIASAPVFDRDVAAPDQLLIGAIAGLTVLHRHLVRPDAGDALSHVPRKLWPARNLERRRRRCFVSGAFD